MARMPAQRNRTMNSSAKCWSLRLLKYVYLDQVQQHILIFPQSLELVLQNINKLNRSLEEVTQVGNEFAPVESLWSHFENVMAKDPNETQEGAQEGTTEHEGDETEVGEERK